MMFLTERNKEIQETLHNLRRQVELLDSHKTVGLITDKQYQESINQITKQVENIEKELGVERYTLDNMFGESMKAFDDMFDMFNTKVHKAIDDVAKEREALDDSTAR